MNYILMSKDIEILKFSYDSETHTVTKIDRVMHPEYAPLGVMEYKTGITRKALNNWWKDRSIPASRSRLKEVMAEMDIHSSVELLERCFGLSLSDQYWIKEERSEIEWKDVNFFENDFSEDMGKLLMGQMNYSDGLNVFSPDNSSDGNLKKKWKIINHIRCLMKGGNSFNNQEPFNELVATKLYERILDQRDYVPYELIQENDLYYSVCPTMVNTDEELVAAYYIDRAMKQRGNDSLYTHFLEACRSLNIPNAKLQIDKMIVCDYIIANYDRHYRNFGAIRNIVTLKWVGIAPIFDSGSSLWAIQPTSAIGSTYNCKPFKASTEEQLKLVNDLSWLDITRLESFEDEVETVFKMNPLMDEVRIQAIVQQIKLRIDKVIARKRQLEKR
ncbi:MAG: excisionase [Erysipelotrichaceae bacterium]|nr:excisionase [Erysipelotrichaceae bacterium]